MDFVIDQWQVVKDHKNYHIYILPHLLPKTWQREKGKKLKIKRKWKHWLIYDATAEEKVRPGQMRGGRAERSDLHTGELRG